MAEVYNCLWLFNVVRYFRFDGYIKGVTWCEGSRNKQFLTGKYEL